MLMRRSLMWAYSAPSLRVGRIRCGCAVWLLGGVPVVPWWVLGGSGVFLRVSRCSWWWSGWCVAGWGLRVRCVGVSWCSRTSVPGCGSTTVFVGAPCCWRGGCVWLASVLWVVLVSVGRQGDPWGVRGWGARWYRGFLGFPWGAVGFVRVGKVAAWARVAVSGDGWCVGGSLRSPPLRAKALPLLRGRAGVSLAVGKGAGGRESPRWPCGAPRSPCGAPSSWRAPSPKGPRSFGTHPPRLRHGTQGGHKKGPRLVATSKTCKGAAPLHNPLAHTPKGAPSGSPWGIPPGPPAARLLLVAVAAAPGCLSVTPRGVGVSEGGLGRPPSEGFPVLVSPCCVACAWWVGGVVFFLRFPTLAFPLLVLGWSACVQRCVVRVGAGVRGVFLGGPGGSCRLSVG